jgi:hypothetical protein
LFVGFFRSIAISFKLAVDQRLAYAREICASSTEKELPVISNLLQIRPLQPLERISVLFAEL